MERWYGLRVDKWGRGNQHELADTGEQAMIRSRWRKWNLVIWTPRGAREGQKKR